MLPPNPGSCKENRTDYKAAYISEVLNSVTLEMQGLQSVCKSGPPTLNTMKICDECLLLVDLFSLP